MKKYILNIKLIRLILFFIKMSINYLLPINNDYEINHNEENNRNIPPHFKWYLMQYIARQVIAHIQNNNNLIVIDDPNLVNQIIFWSVVISVALIEMGFKYNDEKNEDINIED